MERQDQETRAREINLLDLLTELLLHWRSGLVLMLVGAIAIGGGGYVRSVKNYKAQIAAQEAKRQEADKLGEEEMQKEAALALGSELTDAERADVENAVTYSLQYAERYLYQQQSVLMQADALHLQISDLIFQIQADDPEQSYSIKKIYQGLCGGAELYNYIEQEAGQANAAELMQLRDDDSSALSGNNVLHIRIRHSDAAKCKEITKAIAAYLTGKQEELVPLVGEHTIVLISQAFGELMDKDLLNTQKNVSAEVSSLMAALMKLQGEFTEEEQAYFEYLLPAEQLNAGQLGVGQPGDGQSADGQADAAVEETENSAPAKPAVSKKYILVGAVLFLFAYAFVLLMKYILNSRLCDTDNFQKLYGIPQLGAVYEEQKKKKLFSFVDGWIYKLRYLGNPRQTKEQATELAAASVRMAVPTDAVKNICLLDCSTSDNTKELCEQLRQKLSPSLHVEILRNVLYDVQAMEKLKEAQAAVLVGTVGSTLYAEIERELDLLNRQGISVLGGIMAE